jgi:hypothetical protein
LVILGHAARAFLYPDPYATSSRPYASTGTFPKGPRHERQKSVGSVWPILQPLVRSVKPSRAQQHPAHDLTLSCVPDTARQLQPLVNNMVRHRAVRPRSVAEWALTMLHGAPNVMGALISLFRGALAGLHMHWSPVKRSFVHRDLRLRNAALSTSVVT